MDNFIFVILVVGLILFTLSIKKSLSLPLPLPLLSNTGRLGFFLMLVSFIVLLWKNWKHIGKIGNAIKEDEKSIRTSIGIIKFFIVSLLSCVLILLFCSVYYLIRRGRVSSDLTNMLKLGKVGAKKKLKKGKKAAKVEVQTEEQTDFKKEITNILAPVHKLLVIPLLRQNYFKRLFIFFMLYALSLTYFVITKTYTTPTKRGKITEEQNEIFWSIIRGFFFGLIICFFIIFRVLMIEGYEGIKERNINEYVIVFSLISGLSSSLTKYLVKGPLAFIFTIFDKFH